MDEYGIFLDISADDPSRFLLDCFFCLSAASLACSRALCNMSKSYNNMYTILLTFHKIELLRSSFLLLHSFYSSNVVRVVNFPRQVSCFFLLLLQFRAVKQPVHLEGSITGWLDMQYMHYYSFTWIVISFSRSWCTCNSHFADNVLTLVDNFVILSKQRINNMV